MNLDNEMKKCSYCGEEIPSQAGRCTFCGSLLDVVIDAGSTPQNAWEPPQDTPVKRDKTTGSVQSPLSNGMKVFLTMLFTLIPGIGQLAGIITAIVFMNTEDDPDRKSFGVALLVATLIMFVISCIGCFIAVIAISVGTAANY